MSRFLAVFALLFALPSVALAQVDPSTGWSSGIGFTEVEWTYTPNLGFTEVEWTYTVTQAKTSCAAQTGGIKDPTTRKHTFTACVTQYVEWTYAKGKGTATTEVEWTYRTSKGSKAGDVIISSY
ncbi:MAG: hypothetical protein RhofKO_37480 [Rhodothermales bacterium]